VLWTSTLQLVKTALACVIAWTLARHAFDIGQPFLAPWAALLTVHATVFGTLRRGVQQVGATVVGVLVASAAGQLFGVSPLALGLAVLAGLLAGSVRGLRAEATTAAATAIVVLTTGYSDDGAMLADRLLDTGIGVAVGMLVNLVVWPPLRDRGAAHQIDLIDDRIGDLLRDVADVLRGDGEPDVGEWIARTEELDGEIDEAWRVLGQARESGRLNPRRAAAARMRAAEDFGQVLRRLEQAVAEVRSMARTIALARISPAEWDPAFREPWLDLLGRAGAAVAAADPDALKAARADLDGLAEAMDVAALAERFWPVGGALLVNLRNILESLDVVADVQPVEVPRPAALRTG
jgi:uncharacterized membrane protein YgaE (UPF0421/DUF939 family)